LICLFLRRNLAFSYARNAHDDLEKTRYHFKGHRRADFASPWREVCDLSRFVFLQLPYWSLARRALGAQTAPSTPSALHSGARAEFVDEISFYEARYTVPADKYNGRPQGVRSIGEVFAHSVAANYGIDRAFGTPPAGVDFKVIGAAAGDKAKRVQRT